MAAAAHRVARSLPLIAQLVKARPEWTPDVVSQAALEGDLGYEDGKLFLAIDTG